MSDSKPKFIQLHLLTSYPPSNPNRDDLGQPKSAWMGGTKRLRISSQSLKRAWRTSETFKNVLSGKANNKGLGLCEPFMKALEDAAVKPHPHIGIRTKDIGIVLYRALQNWRAVLEEEKSSSAADAENEADVGESDPKQGKGKSLSDSDAATWARDIADKFAVLKESSWRNEQKKEWAKQEESERKLAYLKNDQMVHFSIRELRRLDALTKAIAERNEGPQGGKKGAELDIITHARETVDIALFGRMLAGKEGRANIRDDGSVQVAHAISVHEVQIEDDYFTAVDDLNLDEAAGAGAGFLDTAQFGASLYYQYVCIDRDLLERNLTPEIEDVKTGESADGDEADRPDPEDLTQRTVKALVEAMVKVTPSGKRNPYGHHTYAHYVLAERGYQQPRGLHVAFLQAIDRKQVDWLAASKGALLKTCENLDAVYGACAEEKRYQLDYAKLEGDLSGLLAFVAEGGEGNWAPRSAEELKAAKGKKEDTVDA